MATQTEAVLAHIDALLSEVQPQLQKATGGSQFARG